MQACWLFTCCISWFLGASSKCSHHKFFSRHYFGRCSSDLTELVPLPYPRERPTGYSDRLHDFSVTICRCYKNIYVNSFFPHNGRLWNSLPIECSPLTYHLNDFRSRINKHFLIVGFFLNNFPVCFNLFVLLFLVTPCLVVAVQFCMEWIPIKKKSTKEFQIWLKKNYILC